jgi:Domain of unknown function (DUF5710)
MSDEIYLNVPFAEKDQAKKLGARWHPTRKQWYIPAETNPTPFARWLPPQPNITLLPPVYRVKAPYPYPCVECGHRQNLAFILAATALKDERQRASPVLVNRFSLLNFIEDLPPPLAEFLEKTAPTFRLDSSRTLDKRVYWNHCAFCSALLGDTYLSDPYAPFALEARVLAQRAEFLHLPVEIPIPIRCAYATGDRFDLLERYGVRVKASIEKNPE